MKKSGKCPKCAGVRIVHLATVLDADAGAGLRGAVPRYLASSEIPEGLLGISRKKLAPTEAYVCASCGLVEEHVMNPGAVPWDQVKDARWYTVE